MKAGCMAAWSGVVLLASCSARAGEANQEQPGLLRRTGTHLATLSEPLRWNQLPTTLRREIVPVGLLTFGSLYAVHDLGDNISHSIRKRVDLPDRFDDAAVAGLLGVAALSTLRGSWDERLANLKQAGETAAWIGASTLLLKESVGRRRPEGSPSEGDQASFPSGHTAFAFGAAAYLSNQWTDSAAMPSLAARLLTRAVLYGVATAVGIGRIDHLEHGASDVAAGAGLGWFVTDLVDACYDRDRSGRRYPAELMLDPDRVGLAFRVAW